MELAQIAVLGQIRQLKYGTALDAQEEQKIPLEHTTPFPCRATYVSETMFFA